jgi:hypothetical protein
MKKMGVLEDLQKMSLKIEDLNSKTNCFRDKDSPDNLGMLLKEMKNIHVLLDDLESTYMIRYGLATLKKNRI